MTTKAAEIEAVVDEMVARRGSGSAMDGVTYPYAGNLRLFNHVRFFHPDGTHSDIAGPTYNPQKPTPFLERFLIHWTRKLKVVNGEPVRWYFLTEQAPPAPQPVRCFVPQCTRAGGFTDNINLYQHVMAKHTQEAGMYADVLAEMKKQAQMSLDPEILKSLGMGPTEAPGTDSAIAPSAGLEVFTCRKDGCERFFDTEQGRKLHERKGH